jgi:hypothetical protein
MLPQPDHKALDFPSSERRYDPAAGLDRLVQLVNKCPGQRQAHGDIRVHG